MSQGGSSQIGHGLLFSRIWEVASTMIGLLQTSQHTWHHLQTQRSTHQWVILTSVSVVYWYTYPEQWCSICFDFGEALLLCTGCRIGVCTAANPDSMKGCAVWDPKIEDDDFIFFCPYCVQSQKWKQPCPICTPWFVMSLPLTLIACQACITGQSDRATQPAQTAACLIPT